MKRFLLYLSIVFIPICIGVPIVNYILDPGHIYSIQYIDDVVEGAKKGLNVTNVSNMNERLYKKKLVEINKGKSFDYVIMGSSRLLTLSEDPFGGAKVLNLAVSGAKIEDMIALFQICRENDIHFDNIIIGTDPTLFNDSYMDSRWYSIAEYYYTFVNNSIADNTDMMLSGNNLQLMKQWMLIENLYSFTYFQTALKSIPNYIEGNQNVEYVKTYINEGGTKRPDGSIYYAKKYREKPQKEIDNTVKTFSHQAYLNFYHSSIKQEQMFASMIEAMQKENKDSRIFFFCSPFHPSFYNKYKDVEGFREAMLYIYNYGKTNGITIVGSFNPDDVDFKNSDFYDAVHVRKESIDKLIKGYFND